MKKEVLPIAPKKYTRVFVDDNSTTTWYYDESITTRGPIEVATKYSRSYENSLNKEVSKTKKVRT